MSVLYAEHVKYTVFQGQGCPLRLFSCISFPLLFRSLNRFRAYSASTTLTSGLPPHFAFQLGHVKTVPALFFFSFCALRYKIAKFPFNGQFCGPFTFEVIKNVNKVG